MDPHLWLLLQLVCKAMTIKWKLHAAYRPQSSGMVEKINRTIKVTLAKWMQERWDPLDGCAATRVNEDQNDTPSPNLGYSPYKTMFESPPPLIWEVKGNLLQKGGMEVSQQRNNWER